MASIVPTISVDIPGHGTYSAPSDVVDICIAKYLPNSPYGLRKIAEEQTGLELFDVIDVSSFLLILAEIKNAELINARSVEINDSHIARTHNDPLWNLLSDD